MSSIKRSLCLIYSRSARVTASSLVPQIKTLTIALTIFVSFSFLQASERVVRGQIHGIDADEGAWVGVVSGEPSFVDSHVIPHDKFRLSDRSENPTNWTFTPTGEFELITRVEEEAVLLVVAKNRLPIEVKLQPNSDIGPLELSLSPGVNLNGIVQTKDGKPISGATISISPNSKSYELPYAVRSKWVTGTDGSFRLGGIEEHHYYLLGVTADGFAPVILAGFRIPEGGIEHLEIGIEEGYFVTGQVVDEAGKPIPDTEVKATWKRGSLEVVESDRTFTLERKNAYSFLDTGTLSQSDGSFRIGPFAKGTTGRLYAGSPSVGTAITSEISAPYNGLELRLGQEFIRGRVIDATSGSPLQKFTVYMYRGESRRHTVESTDGVFDLSVFPIDKKGTDITINAPGYSQWTRQVFEGSSGEYDLGDIALEAERPIRGVIRNGGTGSPMEGVRVFGVRDSYYEPVHLAPVNRLAWKGFAVSDKAGRFTLQGGPRSLVDRLMVHVPYTSFASVDLPANAEELDIELNLDGVVEGSLILPDGTPVKGVIEFGGSSWMWPRKFPTEGSFRVENLVPDTYTLKAETDAGLVQERTVVIKASERVSDFDLIVQPGWSASGTIMGLEGLERVEITAQGPESRALVRKRFGNGEYVIHGLPPEVTIVARTSLGHTLVKDFRDGNDSGSTVDFHFEDESGLTGWLTTGGKPLRGVSLKIEPESSSAVVANVTTTDSGRYEARRLSDGRHTIRTDTGHSFEVEIAGDTTFDIELPENSLSGVVRGERTRRPVGDGFVRLVRADVSAAERDIEISKRIGSDGTFLFEGLVAGEYDVHIDYPRVESVSSRMQINGPETIELLIQCASTRECTEGPFDDLRLPNS